MQSQNLKIIRRDGCKQPIKRIKKSKSQKVINITLKISSAIVFTGHRRILAPATACPCKIPQSVLFHQLPANFIGGKLLGSVVRWGNAHKFSSAEGGIKNRSSFAPKRLGSKKKPPTGAKVPCKFAPTSSRPEGEKNLSYFRPWKRGGCKKKPGPKGRQRVLVIPPQKFPGQKAGKKNPFINSGPWKRVLVTQKKNTGPKRGQKRFLVIRPKVLPRKRGEKISVHIHSRAKKTLGAKKIRGAKEGKSSFRTPRYIFAPRKRGEKKTLPFFFFRRPPIIGGGGEKKFPARKRERFFFVRHPPISGEEGG